MVTAGEFGAFGALGALGSFGAFGAFGAFVGEGTPVVVVWQPATSTSAIHITTTRVVFLISIIFLILPYGLCQNNYTDLYIFGLKSFFERYQWLRV
jgi:hypothetical protein